MEAKGGHPGGGSYRLDTIAELTKDHHQPRVAFFNLSPNNFYPDSMQQGKGKKSTSLRLIPRDISEQIGKLPPQAVDLEEAVLGAVMLEKQALDDLAGMLRPEHFYQETHREIFSAVLDLKEEKISIDMRTVVTRLRKTGKIELVGGASYIAELTSKVSSASNIKNHALTILEMSMKRDLIGLASKIHHDAYEDTQDVFELFDKTFEDLEFLKKNSIPKNNESHIKELWKNTLILDAPPEEPPLITIEDTPIVIPGNHTLIAGKKKSRKTLFIVYLISLYLKANKANASKVILFDTEQGKSHVYALRMKIHQLCGLWVPVFYLRGQSPTDRMDFIEQTVKYWPNPPKLIVIDGIRDLMSNINDPDESTNLIVWLERLTLLHNVGVLNILHLNKTDNNPRGHIGTELLNKALCTIEMELDEKNGCTVVKCESARDKAFNTFAFTHDANGLPEVVGTPMAGQIVSMDEKKRRLEAVFEGGPLKYKELKEEIQLHFELSINRAERLITTFVRDKLIMKSGKPRDPNTVYKLLLNGNGTHAPEVVQTTLPLEKKYEKAEEPVDSSDLPF